MGFLESGIGPALRNERSRQQLSLDDVSKGTRISPRFLDAIEKGQLDQLPGIVFARNFVRQYATYLRMDPEPLLAGMPRFDLESAPLPNPPAKASASRWNAIMTPAASAAVWCILAVGAAGGGWWYFEHPKSAIAQTSSPRADTPASPAPVLSTATPTPSGPDPQAASSTPAIEGAVSPSSTLPSPDIANRPVQVVLTARESSWVQVTADGHTTFVGMLKANDTKAVGADSLVKVVAGNAGGLLISLNGKPLDPIGLQGQVRTVRLTAEGPEFVQKTRPASDPL